MRRISGLLATTLVITSMGVTSPVEAVEPFPLDVAPVWAVVDGSNYCCFETEAQELVTGQSWAVGDEVDLFIDGTYVATSMAEANDEGSASPVFDINALGVYLEPGRLVELARTDGGRTESHTITNLRITDVEVATDTLTGTATPGAEVWVFIPNTLAYRVEIADASGRWMANFSDPGDEVGEEVVFNLEPFTFLGAAEFDAAGSATVQFTAPLEFGEIVVFLDGAEVLGAPSRQFVSGQGWIVGEDVYVYVNGTYVTTGVAQPNDEGTATPDLDVNAAGVTVVPGDEIQLVGSISGPSELHVVAPLSISSIDVDADTVSGTGGALEEVIAIADGAVRFVAADAAGDWDADFSSPGLGPLEGSVADLVGGSAVQALWFDGSGSATTLYAEAAGALDPLILGTLLPETGPLTFLGVPMVAGARLAVDDINAAGGALGGAVQLVEGDSGSNPTVAGATVATLLGDGTDVIVGAETSSTSFAVIDQIVGGGAIQFSPSNTAAGFTNYPDAGRYFRTSPSNALQGEMLAEIVVAEDGTAAVVYRDDDYGASLAVPFAAKYADLGGTATLIPYVPGDSDFADEVAQVVALDPGAVLLVGFGESVALLETLDAQGVSTVSGTALWGVDGNIEGFGPSTSDPTILTGLRGTVMRADFESIPGFTDRLDGAAGGSAEPYVYGAETYDAVVITALAAEVAGSADPALIAEEIVGVTRDGEVCNSFSECLALVQAGADIDYDGLGGPYEFNTCGDPTTASFAIVGYDGSPTPADLDFVFPATESLAAGPFACQVQEPSSPALVVFRNGESGETDSIGGFDFEPGSTVTLSIDLGDDGSIDHEDAAVIDESRFVIFEGGLPTLDAGDRVSLTDDSILPRTKSHLVDLFSVTEVDVDADTVSGEGPPGTELTVRAIDPVIGDFGGLDVVVTVDATGTWLADFSGVFDLVALGSGWVRTTDDDGDGTQVGWAAPGPPIVEVNPFVDTVRLPNWPIGASVTVTIDDDADPGNGVLATRVGQIGVADPGEPAFSMGFVDFFPDVDIVPGHVVRGTDGSFVSEHVVTPLGVTEVDLAADTFVGTANPGGRILIFAAGETGFGRRDLVASASGAWTADFSVEPADPADGYGTADLAGQFRFVFGEYGVDRDTTVYHLPEASIGVTAMPGRDWIDVQGTGLSPVTVTVESPTGDLLYETVIEVARRESGELDGFVIPPEALDPRLDFPSATIDLAGIVDLVPGQVVTASDVVYQDMTFAISVLTVDEVDTAAETVSGTAGPDNEFVYSVLSGGAGVQSLDIAGGAWSGPMCENEPFDSGTCVPVDLTHDTVGITFSGEITELFDTFTNLLWDLDPDLVFLDVPTTAAATVPVDLAATFTDREVPDNHAVTVDWGDGTAPQDAPIVPTPGPGSGGTAQATHAYDIPATYVVEVTVVDALGGEDVATAEIAVGAAPNQPPTAIDDRYDAAPDVPLVVAVPGVLGNDSDPDGDPLTAVLVGPPAHGSVDLAADGTFSYTPAPGWSGIDTFTYEADDGQDRSAPATVEIDVTSAPVANADEYVLDAGQTLTTAAGGQWAAVDEVINSLANGVRVVTSAGAVAVDPAGNAYVVGTASHNLARLDADGTWRVAIGPNGNGQQPLTAPADVATDPAGNAFVIGALSGNLFRFDAGGAITRVEVDYGSGFPRAVTTDSAGDVFVAVHFPASNAFVIYRTNPALTWSREWALIPGDTSGGALATDADRSVWIAAPTVGSVYRIGTGGGPVDIWSVPGARAVETHGNDAYVTTTTNQVVRISAAGLVTQVLGPAGDDTTPLIDPRSVDVDGAGNVYVTSPGSSSVFRVRPDGSVMRIMGVAANELAITEGGTLYVTDASVDAVYRGSRVDGVLDDDRDPDGDPLSAILVSGPDHGTLDLLGNGSFTYVPDPGFVGVDAFRYAASDGVATRDAIVSIRVLDPRSLLTGTVSSAAGPLVGATVEVCDGAGWCRVAETNAAGRYEFPGLASTVYAVRVFPPAGSTLNEGSQTVAVSPGQQIEGVDVLLTQSTVVPDGVVIQEFDGRMTWPPGSTPYLLGIFPVTYAAEACPGGMASISITSEYFAPVESPMSEGPPGTYSVSLEVGWRNALATVTIDIGCPSSSDQQYVFEVSYIDPSGAVVDGDGAPVAGATVTLLRSDTGVPGTFEAIPDGSAIMSPANRTNPDTTGAAGQFAWDVLAGFYVVRAEAEGCHAPGDPATPTVETDVLVVPPPAIGLELTLECGQQPGLRAELEDIRDELTTLLDDRELRGRDLWLTRIASRKIDIALWPNRWNDRGEPAKASVLALVGSAARVLSRVDADEVEPVVDGLVTFARRSAEHALVRATIAGAPEARIDRAATALGKGDAATRPEIAIRHYRKAWTLTHRFD